MSRQARSGNPLLQRSRLFALAALACVLVMWGAYIARAPGPAPEPRRKLAMPSTPLPSYPEPDGPPAAEEATVAAGNALSFDGFIKALEGRAAEPAVAPMAKAFSKRFMAEPALRHTYHQFRQSSAQGKKPTAAGFLSALRRQPAFGKLTAEFGSHGGAAGTLQSFMQQPDLRRFAHAQAFALGNTQGAVKPAPLVNPARHVAPEGTATTPTMTAGARPSQASAAGASPAEPKAGQALPAATASPTSPPASATGASGAAKANVHNVFGTPPVPDTAGPVQTDELLKRHPWLANLTPQERAAIVEWADNGIWGACFRLGLHQRCAAACAAARPGTCSARNAWDSCMEFHGSEDRCAAECRSRGICQPSADVLARLCAKEPPPGYCAEVPKPPAAASAWPCQPSPTVAVDCSTWDDAEADAKESFMGYWKGSLGHTEEWVKQRWVWERTQDKLDPNWREREYGEGWNVQPTPGPGVQAPAAPSSDQWPCRPTEYVSVDCKTFEDATESERKAFLDYWGGTAGMTDAEVRKRWVWERNKDRAEKGWRDREYGPDWNK